MKNKFLQEVAEKLGPRLGFTPTAAAFALSTAMTVGLAIYQNMTLFDNGWEACEAALSQGQLELDGKVAELLTDADREALDAYSLIKMTRAKFDKSQDKTVTAYGQLLSRHLSKLKDANNVPKTDWGSRPVADHARLRLDTIEREREADGSGSPDDPAHDQEELAGYPPLKPITE